MPKPAAPTAKPSPSQAICGVCAAEVRAPFQPPASTASPDLDMRPGEPARSTLRRWLVTCPFCEAVAPDLSRLNRAARVAMSVPSYLGAKGPRASIPFVQWSMLCPKPERADALLHAAWAADDADEPEAATFYRRQAAACWPEPMPVSSALRLIDVLRRAGDNERATAQAAILDTVDLDDTATRILAYQRKLIAAGDTGRHLLSSAMPPPAPSQPAEKPAPPKLGRRIWSWFKRK